MKKLISIFGAVMTALFLCPKLQAAAGGQQVVDMYLPINPVQAYSSTFSVRTDGLNWASAQVLVTSVTQPSSYQFNDGQAATTSLTVASYQSMSTATATGSLTVVTNSALTGACVSGGGPGLGSFNVCNPNNWLVGNVSSNTACNIAAAIQASGVILSTCGVQNGSVIYDSAPYASVAFDSFQVASSTQLALTVPNLVSSNVLTGVGIGTLFGGQSALSFSLNGQTFTAFGTGVGAFSPVTSNGQTATNIATAITNSSTTIGIVAHAGGSVVYATATVTGTGPNSYATFTSSQGILNLEPFASSGAITAQGTLLGGSGASYSIGSPVIVSSATATAGTGLAVLYPIGSTALAPLITGVTYYMIAPPQVAAGTFELALVSTNAVAGIPIVFTSSLTKTTADVFSLAPLASTGTPSVQWVVSDDNTNWTPYTLTPFNITLSSVSYASYSVAGTLNTWDFGHMDFSWLGLSVTAPTAGAITVKAKLAGDQ